MVVESEEFLERSEDGSTSPVEMGATAPRARSYRACLPRHLFG
jgi:hypothetical protein